MIRSDNAFSDLSGEVAVERPHYYLTRTTCAKATHDAIFASVPKAKNDPVILRYVVFALFTSWRDKDTHRRILNLKALEWIWGVRLNQGRNRGRSSASGKDVLDHLKACLPGIKYKDPIPNRRCGLLIADGLPEKLWQIVQSDIQMPVSQLQDRVYVVSGGKYGRRYEGDLRKKHFQKAMSALKRAPSDTSRYIGEHMNCKPGTCEPRPSHLFSKMAMRVPDALTHVTQMPIEAKKAKYVERIRKQYITMLRHIQDQPQPFYGPSSNLRTDRVFSVNPSVLQMPGEIRHLLCKDLFYEIDLKSAHLAICAKLWNCSRVVNALNDGRDVWNELRRYFNLKELPSPVKRAFKKALYSIVYGMKRSAVKAELTKALQNVITPPVKSRSVGEYFVDHWIPNRLLDARRYELRAIERNGYGLRADGEKVYVTVECDKRSVMATIAQSYEAELMKPVLQYEEEHHKQYASPQFHVVLWQHDGCSIRCPADKVDYHMKALQGRVRKVAEKYRMPTYLTIDKHL